ncbi:hypothetical protein Ahy_A09g045207 [Arachis hypogaea]|uniref:Uncharacterized protein n=1 Tax=Arachis hypogaea TaxID=3818 RepID=A0A445BLU2_ARAHY|nr:hypothetical protein Ahy_A09g045207 [Arachis hypogaea]
MKPSNGRKIVLKFNERLQPVGNEVGILSGILGLLGSDYTKFSICRKDWKKVRSKNKIYNECVKNDLLSQALGKEHPDRMRDMGIGPTSSQVL